MPEREFFDSTFENFAALIKARLFLAKAEKAGFWVQSGVSFWEYPDPNLLLYGSRTEASQTRENSAWNICIEAGLPISLNKLPPEPIPSPIIRASILTRYREKSLLLSVAHFLGKEDSISHIFTEAYDDTVPQFNCALFISHNKNAPKIFGKIIRQGKAIEINLKNEKLSEPKTIIKLMKAIQDQKLLIYPSGAIDEFMQRFDNEITKIIKMC